MASTTPFDDLAADYDAAFTRTALGAALRELVWERFDALIEPGQRVLELGCGTGEDAVQLARSGIDVVATDPSLKMLQVAQAKAHAARCSDRIQFLCERMERVPDLLHGAQFDAVVSNFGALNCVKDLPSLLRGVAMLCAPRANIVFVVMGRYVPWEWAWYAAHGEARKAMRRLRRHGVDWHGLTISYPTPRTLASLLAPQFEVTRIAPLGCVLPPSYAGGWLQRSPLALKTLASLERIAHRCAPLASLADHYVIEARREFRFGS
jgi:ubiquinone/menaquinone biosynthesis C-methylase UbiE